jgi:hypothetical protein
VRGVVVEDEEEHPLWVKMNETGTMKKIVRGFERCESVGGKRSVGLMVLDVWRGNGDEEKYKEIVKWMRENTTVSINPFYIRSTLFVLRKLVYRFYFFLFSFFSFSLITFFSFFFLS